MSNTVTRKGKGILVTISETGAGSSTEETLAIGIQKGRVMRQVCRVTSGSASTVDPILTRVTSGTGIDIVLENDTAAATVDNSVSGGVPFFAASGNLFHKSVPNAGSDNAIASEYYIVDGWE